ncbi:MAG: hypothetical protein ABI859_00575 [Pseudomonadota bacterium]
MSRRLLRVLSSALSLAVVAQLHAAPDPVATAPELTPANVNPYLRADRRDPLDRALIRLARVAMSADLSTNEPWLFDRATVYYKLAQWTGDAAFRSHALELVDKYYANIDSRGQFLLKPDDGKYAYIDGAVWYEFETGNRKFRPQAEAIYRMWLAEIPSRYSPTSRIWTEREIAYAFGAALGWYELSRDPAALARARELLQQWADMSAASGAPLHTLAQHQEAFEPPWGPRRMTSPWMAALFFEYLQHYYRLTGDRLALTLVSDYADFTIAHCLYDGSLNHPNLAGRLMPYYLCDEQGSYEQETPSEADGEHTPDVMGLMAYAVYAKRQLGLDPKAALKAYRGLRESAGFFVDRRADVNPPRKINWWIGSAYDSAYLVK